MTDQPRVLVLAEKSDPQLSLLETLPHVLVHDANTAHTAAADASVLFHWSGPRDLLRQVFLAAPQIRWVHSRAAGVDSLLFPELVQSEIPLTNGSGVFSQSLGEFALAAILYFAKDFPRMLHNQRSAIWEPFDVDEISSQTVGIVGYGDIGRAVARRCHAMGMRVLALKRHPPQNPDPLVDGFYKPEALMEMLELCDYIVVSAPLTAETRHMVSKKAFAAMRSTAVVVNVGRGPVIDEEALIEALREKRIRGAGLDVFEQEPLLPDNPLWQMHNVLISPHTADHTRDWLDQAARFFLQQYERFRCGEPLENVVNKHLGY